MQLAVDVLDKLESQWRSECDEGIRSFTVFTALLPSGIIKDRRIYSTYALHDSSGASTLQL